MAATARAVAAPSVTNLLHERAYPLLWPDHPGALWTPNPALPNTILELTVHWTEADTPAGKALGYYQQVIAEIAHYHAFVRNWNADPAGPFIPGFGFMYHYAITPPDAAGLAHVIQTQPETLRTWNASKANGHNLAVVLLAGHNDPVSVPMVNTLKGFLNWMVSGRGDLPGVTARPSTVAGLGGKVLNTFGVTLHDEERLRDNLPPKGCPGPYGPVVASWRASA